jgi:hypothetical protein
MRVLIGLRALTSKHSAEEINAACETALAHGAYRLRTIRTLLKRNVSSRQRQFAFLEEHPVIRPLSDYSLDSLTRFRKDRTDECQTD